MAISLNDAVMKAKEAPCASEIVKIITNEVRGGNIVKAFDRITSLSDEAYYILLFSDSPKADYTDIKLHHKKDGTEYKVIVQCDNDGCTEIRFNY